MANTVIPAPVTMLPAEADSIAVVAKFFRALGDPTRLRLLEFLLHEEHTVGECVTHVGLAQSRVSTHLACLADCGYVQARKAGRNTFYRVADPRVAQLVGLAHALAADNCDALCACHAYPPRPSMPERPGPTPARHGSEPAGRLLHHPPDPADDALLNKLPDRFRCISRDRPSRNKADTAGLAAECGSQACGVFVWHRRITTQLGSV